MAKKAGIDPKSRDEFFKTIREFTQQVKADIEMVGREQMRLMCRDAMTFTPPMPEGGGRGLSEKAYKAGAGKLAKDVKRIFIPADGSKQGKSVFLKQIISAVKGNGPTGKSFLDFIDLQPTEKKIRGLSPIMRKIMQDQDPRRAFAKASNYLNKARADGRVVPVAGMADDPKPIHERYKNAVGGRWKKGQKLGGPQYFVESQSKLDAYIASRQMSVGRVKAGWAAALRQIPKSIRGGKEANYGVYDAPWVDRNISSMGRFSQTKTATGVSMTISNMIGNINGVSDDAGTVNIVYGNRVKQMNNAIQARLQKAIDRANRK